MTTPPAPTERVLLSHFQHALSLATDPSPMLPPATTYADLRAAFTEEAIWVGGEGEEWRSDAQLDANVLGRLLSLAALAPPADKREFLAWLNRNDPA